MKNNKVHLIKKLIKKNKSKKNLEKRVEKRNLMYKCQKEV